MGKEEQKRLNVGVIMGNLDAPWLLLNGNRKMIKREIFARWIDQQTEI